MSKSKIKFRYVEEKNPKGAYIPGVQNRNIMQSDAEKMPPHLYLGVTQCVFFEDADPVWTPEHQKEPKESGENEGSNPKKPLSKKKKAGE